MLYYLPGCTTNKNHPSAGKKMQEYMKRKGAKIAKCCKFDVGYFGEGDIVVQNCTQCDFVLKERRSDIKVISLYEYVMADPNFSWSDHSGLTVTIQDCIRTRNNSTMQEAVRNCLLKMNINFVEAGQHHTETRYCGVWLNNPANPAAVSVAPKFFAKLEQYRNILTLEEQKVKMQEYVKQYESDKVVVYCNGCENGLQIGGLNPTHMIELLAEGI